MKSAIVILACAILATTVHCEEATAASESKSGPKFSLEEIMLLADAAEKAQKKGSDDDKQQASNFQHRLQQLVQTARVAAGSGQSTGNEVLDQTIRQVRARINANGGSVSDTSIFDAAIRAIGSGSQQSGTLPSNLVNTVIQQFQKTDEQTTTTPAPQQDSLLGRIIRQLADGNKNGQSDAGSSILDAVVNQLVSTTTTTTTTTTTPRPASVLQILDGLVKTYQSQKSPTQNDGSQNSGGSPGQATSLLNGLQGLLAQFQRPQAANGPASSASSQGGESTPPPQGANQLLEGLLNQIKQLQNKNTSPDISQRSPTAPPNPSGTPDIGALLKQIQSAIADRSTVSSTPSADEEFIKKAASEVIRDNTEKGVTASPPATGSVTTPNILKQLVNEDPSKVFGSFLNKLNAGGASNGDGGSLQGLLKNIFTRQR